MKTETINLLAVAAQQAGTEKAELHKKILLYPSYRANFLYTHLVRIKTLLRWQLLPGQCPLVDVGPP